MAAAIEAATASAKPHLAEISRIASSSNKPQVAEFASSVLRFTQTTQETTATARTARASLLLHNKLLMQQSPLSLTRHAANCQVRIPRSTRNGLSFKLA